MSEKRSQNRMGIATEMMLMSEDGQELGAGAALDLSEGGVFVTYLAPSVFEQITKGQKLRYSCRLATGPVEGRAVVAWIDENRSAVGLSFSSVDNSNGLENLLEYVHSAFMGTD